jgi:DNA repair exonuclease SbcCD ATPase subunit
MIVLEKIRWKNFLSTGNHFTEINLTNSPTTLVSGENGAGKSTILDALTFSLFGKSFRGSNIPQLVNSINEKDCVVEIEFQIGKVNYKIIRGLKPKIFEIYKDGKLIDQDSKSKDYQRMLEDQILKMNYKSFTQVVILGSSNYVPFMQLNAGDRRSVVESLLDINIFSVMNILIKGRLQTVRENIKDIEHGLELIKTKTEEKKKYIEKLEKKSNESVELWENEKKEQKQKVSELQAVIKDQEKCVADLLAQVTDKDYLPKSLSKMESTEDQLKNKLKNIEKTMKFYEENDTCPSCKQDIEKHHKDCVFEEKSKEHKEIESALVQLSEHIETTEKRLGDINVIVDTVRDIQTKISQGKISIENAEKHLEKCNRNIENILGEQTEVSDAVAELNQLIGEGKQQVGNRKEYVDDLHYLEIAASLFKDTGIKSKIIKHYLPIMNKLINKYLTSMDFFCQFTLDENFNETIKSRHRDDFTYQSFSEGERLRIDLSLLLAWREIARLKNSVSCNLLMLDEVFDSSLDAVGTDEFMRILNRLGNRNNIFVISHKADQLADKFRNSMHFEKKNNFSRMI